jgi:hypothetical protein
MNSEVFLKEAEALARPCRLLSLEGSGAPNAYWHGLASGLCLSLCYEDVWLNISLNDDYTSGSVQSSTLPITSHQPLFAETSISLPPVDAVFLCGSDVLASFLKSYDWPRDEPFNSNFPDPIPHEYECLWQKNCPLFDKSIAAMSGGWHMPWPDGDWHDFLNAELICWTFLNAEPWIEVFKLDGNFIVKQETASGRCRLTSGNFFGDCLCLDFAGDVDEATTSPTNCSLPILRYAACD